jgi:uncharacterized protein
MSNEPRIHRAVVTPMELETFEVTVKETHLRISAMSDLSAAAEDLTAQARWQIESFTNRFPRFAETWAPIDVPADAPDLVKSMLRAAALARVGPMSAVTGVIAEYVARGLAPLSAEVVVENGCDVYLIGSKQRTVVPQARSNSLKGHVALRIPAGLLPIAVSTATGAADAATVLARDGALADAVATALANRVHTAEDIQRALDASRAINGVLGLLVVLGDHLGAWGNVHLTALD